MELMLQICLALTFGVIIGMVVGAIKALTRKKDYTESQIEGTKKLAAKLATPAKWATFMTLIVGIIWCIYFLVLGAVDPTSVDYATGMSQLIVSVLTIVSIMFAFFEFLRRK